MTSVEILKQASSIVAGIIKEKTPSVFETCRAAYSTLGDLVAYAKQSDDVTEEFANGITDVIKRLEPFRAGILKSATVAKKMDEAAFAAYVKEQVEKALAEESAPALQRLYALQGVLAKASFEGTTIVSIDMYVDPWQQATLLVEDGSRQVTSGTTQTAEVSVGGTSMAEVTKGAEGVTLGDVMKSVVQSVDKAARDRVEMDTGWSMDLTSNEFLHGKRKIDFGQDGAK